MVEPETARWEGRAAAELARAWSVPEVRLFERTGSTNDVARRLALQDARQGTVVIADEQTAGRGRVGRAWNSHPGLGVWMSVVARPTSLRNPGVVPLRVGLAAAAALDRFVAPHGVQVKWPNDLFVAGRKLGGILCESAWDGDGPSFLVVGIGINVAHASGDFPLELREGATSLRIASGRAAPRDQVAGAVLRELLPVLQTDRPLRPDEIAALAARDPLLGREVVVTEPATGARTAQGASAGVAPDGALLVREHDGALRAVRSGTVRVLDGAAV